MSKEMKKFTYLATMLLIMAGAVSCEKKSDVKNQESKLQPTGEMRDVSVAAGQGTTKTSVSNGVLTWSEGDKLYVAPTAGGIDAATLNITSGVGTASGLFHGRVDSAIEDDTQLYGWAGGAWTYNSGAFTVNMPATQTYVENGLAENAYPSIGTGTIKGGVSLQNPFGVLSLNVKGKDTDAVKNITVTSATKNIAGVFTVDPSTLAVSGGSSKTITLTFTDAVSLTSDGVRFYMVFPAAEYPAGDLTVTVTKTDDSTIEVSLGAITVSAGNATVKQEVKEPIGRGEAYANEVGDNVKWVQLWENGPKWAEYNVGSNANHDYNAYYTWGGIARNGTGLTWEDDHYTGSESVLPSDYDTATKLWGNSWRMYTLVELSSLYSKCTVEWTDNYNGTGKKGRIYTGKDDYSSNSVFFPAAGYCGKSGVSSNDKYGHYWTSDASFMAGIAYYMSFYLSDQTFESYGSTNSGKSVRAVLNE